MDSSLATDLLLFLILYILSMGVILTFVYLKLLYLKEYKKTCRDNRWHNFEYGSDMVEVKQFIILSLIPVLNILVVVGLFLAGIGSLISDRIDKYMDN